MALSVAGSGRRAETRSRLRQRTDGRLDRSRDSAILDAALAALTEHGYNGTNMNDVATRAGVGKAAIYRRWSSKAALITDALVYWRPDLIDDAAPDTGSLAGDFDALVERVARNDSQRIPNDLVLRVAMEAMHDQHLTSALDDLLLLKGRRMVTAILNRAEARGELAPGRDWSLIADVLTGLGLMQAINGQSVDATFIRRVIDTLILPAVCAANTAPGGAE
ncbi:TetR/AcrR family transcriptional regulator [Mycolicibacter senuensis]|uniref:TetR family transcriptional regulator n=1 Tax=Mycolicibacter senuensis TaxID=386913 RepID=A0A7I9XJD2_9MYCO|nr:TetR/AcrR family transcriptional regulator [Mycolicibacter senuensis]MDQ2626096.1 TetR/AcrR family transcriptional regulator [Actinomycetota bacterium]ORW67372.1 TetR family transcriptional regulator [Mycolicibacter senuensis]GFG69556.1 TetR family transcriptional regulator [Mycolicibacter senuensis]